MSAGGVQNEDKDFVPELAKRIRENAEQPERVTESVDTAELERAVTFKQSTSSKPDPFPRERYLQFIKRLRVQSRDYGMIPFGLLGSQRHILDEVCKGLEEGVTTFIILKSRQVGSTTFWISVDLFWSFEYPGLLGTYVLHKEEARDEWRSAIEVFYQDIPTKYRVRMLHHNRNILSFDNGSRFRYVIAGTSEKRRGGMGRSSASNFVHGTECAFYGNADDIAAFKSSISSMYKHRLQVWESTANGFNHFWETWEQAKTSPAMRAIFVGWWRDERNAFASDDPRFKLYIGPRLSMLERQKIREVKRLYDFDITKNQLAWIRWKMEDMGCDQATMDQEMPWTEDEAFQATGSQYFTTTSLRIAMLHAKKQHFQAFRYKFTHNWEETEVAPSVQLQHAELRIWEHASKFGYYSVGCDPAYGSSDEADRNVISVWRAYSDCLVQVAEFASSVDSTYQTAWALAHLAGFYGQLESRVILEINGPGKAVFQELQLVQQRLRELKPSRDNFELRHVLRNMRHFFYRKVDNIGSGDLVYHWNTTHDLKPGLMARFKDSVELGRVIIRSVPLLEEMRKVVNQEGYITAEGAGKDDRVMAAALAHENWQRWMWQRLRQKGYTRERSAMIERDGGEKPLDRMVLNYLKKQGISVPGISS